MIVSSIIFVLCFAVALGTPPSFTTSAGRQISVPVLSRHLGIFPRHEWGSRIVELTEHEHLVTQTMNHAMNHLHFQTRLFQVEDGVPVLIDGKAMQRTSFEYLTKTVGDYTVSYRLDKTPFSIKRHGTVLHPLHATNHPGVFLDLSTFHDGAREDDRGAVPNFNGMTLNNSTRSDPESIHTSLVHSPCRRGDPQRLLELAVAFDSTLCEAYKDFNFALAVMTDALYMGMLPYHRQTCVRLKIVFYEGFCTTSKDPYTEIVSQSDTAPLMSDLAQLWFEKRKRVKRDLVYLFTYSGPGSSGKGSAIIGGVCNHKRNVIWSKYIRTTAIAHQIGHALGAEHTADGDLMDTNRNKYTNQYFGEETLSKIEGFIERKGGCLSTISQKNPLEIPGKNAEACQSDWDIGWPLKTDFQEISTLVFKFSSGDAKLKIYYRQWVFALDIFLLAESGYSIVRYRRRPAMKKVKKNALGVWVDLKSNPSKRVWSQWLWTEVERPSSMKTCCGEDLYIHLEIELRSQSESGQSLTKFVRITNPVFCAS